MVSEDKLTELKVNGIKLVKIAENNANICKKIKEGLELTDE